MSNFLFNEFDKITPTAWKQKIQVDLKGADYNNTLLWKTNEGISVKPFYTKEDNKNLNINTPKKGFNICQTIFIDDENIANSLAKDALKRGANSIQFITNNTFNYKLLLKNIDLKEVLLHFKFNFLNDQFQIEISNYLNANNTYFQTDIIGNLAESGNWYTNLKEDYKKLENIISSSNNCISISADLYQNAGANIVQQLAYALSHANEYLNYFDNKIANKIHFTFSLGGNYFFEIAKLRAFRLLWESLLIEYNIKDLETHIFIQPSLRNKTLYDYNVNMLRTTSECMSGILGGANTISNISYDRFFNKSSEFSERISRNQLLILQQESELKNGQNYANGSYYIESLTNELAEKSLEIFKLIEKKGGFLKQLKEGVIQRKINENSLKEEKDFQNNQIKLLGTNFLPNTKDTMNNNYQLYPFIKQRNIKTLIPPIIRKRLSESLEKERVKKEKGIDNG